MHGNIEYDNHFSFVFKLKTEVHKICKNDAKKMLKFCIISILHQYYKISLLYTLN